MRRVVAILLALGGCDRVLLLQHVDYEGRDGGADGAVVPGDLGTDGQPYTACTSPAPFVGAAMTVLPGYSEATSSELAGFGVAIAAGNAFYIGEQDLAAPISPQNNSWSHPALTPDGSQLYMFNTSGQTFRFERVGGSTWSPGESTDPGTNELRMMVFEGSELREHASTDGGVTWDVVSSQTRSIADLTGLVGGVMDYQGLTPDAATLVFTVAGTSMDGVWYIRRTDFDINNNFSTMNTIEYGRLLSMGGVKTPYLDANCSLYVGYGNDVVRFDPPL